MALFKFAGLAIASFATFTLIANLLPSTIAQLVALIVIAGVASPFFLSRVDDDTPNQNGGLEALLLLVFVAVLTLAVWGWR